MTINFRFSPKKTVQDAKGFIYSIIDKKLIHSIDCAPSCFVSSQKIAKYLRDGPEKEIMQAWTDISQLNAAGIPAINFGAGDIKLAHKPEEFINIEELRNFYEVLKLHI
jgi:succinyl-diaminopimelate desuccinylase